MGAGGQRSLSIFLLEAVFSPVGALGSCRPRSFPKSRFCPDTTAEETQPPPRIRTHPLLLPPQLSIPSRRSARLRAPLVRVSPASGDAGLRQPVDQSIRKDRAAVARWRASPLRFSHPRWEVPRSGRSRSRCWRSRLFRRAAVPRGSASTLSRRAASCQSLSGLSRTGMVVAAALATRAPSRSGQRTVPVRSLWSVKSLKRE